MQKAKGNAENKIEKLMYRRDEAAFALGLSVRSIDSMIADKKMRTRRFGRAVLIPAADVRKIADDILRSDMIEGTGSKGPRLVVA